MALNKRFFNMRVLLVLGVVLVASFFCVADSFGDGKYTKTIRSASGKSSALVLREADSCLSHGDDGRAFVLCMVVCNRFKDSMDEADKEHCASAYLKAGDVYYGQGNYTGALDLYIRGLKVCESTSKRKKIAMFYKNIGNVYCMFQDYERGAECFKAGYAYSKEVGDTGAERRLAVNLTGIYLRLRNLPEVRKYHKESIRLRRKGDPENTFMIEFNEGLILMEERHYGMAVAIFRRLASYAAAHRIADRYVCSAYQETYRAYEKLDNADSTLFFLDKCYAKAVQSGILHVFPELLKDYSEFYERQGQVAKSQAYKARYFTLTDSVYNLREFDAVKNIQFQYEMDKTNKEISELNAAKERRGQTIRHQRMVIAFTLLAVLVVSAFLVIVWRQKRRLRESYADLYALNRRYIADYDFLKKRHDDDLGRMEALKGENQRLISVVDASGGQENSADKQPEQRKYRSSNLSDSQRVAIADEITRIMEDTSEFCAPDFSLDRLAELVGSNSKYVSQVINDTFGKNFSNYVNEYRIRLACIRLSDDALTANFTIKAIGEGLGFKSYASFINVFRRQTGLTPSLYQKMAREGKE